MIQCPAEHWINGATVSAKEIVEPVNHVVSLTWGQGFAAGESDCQFVDQVNCGMGFGVLGLRRVVADEDFLVGMWDGDPSFVEAELECGIVVYYSQDRPDAF